MPCAASRFDHPTRSEYESMTTPVRRKRQKAETVDLKFILRRRGSGPLQFYGTDANNPILGENVLVLSPREVREIAAEFVDGVCSWDSEVSSLSIVCPLEGKVDLTPILDAVESRKSDGSMLTIHGGLIGADTFDRILQRWPWIRLVGCAFDKGWWRRSRKERTCTTFWIENCTAVEPTARDVGVAAWPELSHLMISSGDWDPDLNSRTAIAPQAVPTHLASFAGGAPSFVRALYAPHLVTLSVFCCREISILKDLPESRRLKELNLDGCPADPQTLEWVARQANLRSLSLSWKPDMQLPWQYLANLRRLRELGVSGARFTDADLTDVARFTTVRTLHAWYTDLTSASWPLVLSMPNLRSFWISSQMLVGEIPSQLPDETSLREVVAMNVGDRHMDYLRRLMSRYPSVELCEM